MVSVFLENRRREASILSPNSPGTHRSRMTLLLPDSGFCRLHKIVLSGPLARHARPPQVLLQPQ